MQEFEPAYFMGAEVFPLDPELAKRERFISLHQLIHWLEKSHPKGAFPPPDMALLGLAERHIKAGRLKTYGASVIAVPRMVSVPREIVEDGKVHQVEVLEMRVDTEERPENPLLDIFEFTDWFREINPNYLKLPDNWPANEPGPAAPEVSEPGQRQGEINRWLRDKWESMGRPGGADFFRDLKKHSGAEGSPIIRWCNTGKSAGVTFRTSSGVDEFKTSKTIRNSVSRWKTSG